MMKFLLTAINAKYIHSNPGVYSLKMYAEQEKMERKTADEGGAVQAWTGLPDVHVEIGEYTINNQMDQILEDVYRRKPDIVGISCYIWNVNYGLQLARDLHKVLPDVDIWLGGPEVSFDGPRILEKEPEILGIMKGEGEETFAALLQCYEELGNTVQHWRGQKERSKQDDSKAAEDSRKLESFWKKLELLPAVSYRDGDGQIKDHPVRPVMDMSRIPFLYKNLEGFENRIVYYESSRGCPFSCSYCLSSIDKSVRFRDLRLVKQELGFFLEQRVPQVKFVDRTFNCKKSHAMEIWRFILEHDNGVTNFHFEIAADLLDEDALALMEQMRPGLIQLEIGVQSTNPATIREIRRTMNLEKVRQVTARINAGHNVHQHLDLIAGLPFEDYSSFAKSFNDVYAMEPEQLQLGFLKVLKGSYMYEMAEQYGLVYREEPPYEVLATNWLPYGDVLRLKGVEDMVEVYYNSRQFTETLRLLEPWFPDPFSMFEALAEYYEKNQLCGLNHSRLARYEILHRFIQTRQPEKEELFQLEDALMTDLYLRENAKSRPSFALDQQPFKEIIRSMEPELRRLGNQIHVEVFRSGRVLRFDYRERDPLTRNAEVRPIGTVKPEGQSGQYMQEE